MARSPIPTVDIFDREAVFIERVLAGLVARLPGAEDRLRAYHHRRGGRLRRGRRAERRRDGHAAASASSTATRCSRAASARTAYCLPVAKRERHRLAVRRAATSGSAKFFLGTDSAPHAVERQGSGLRLRRHLQRAVRARSLCDGVRGGRRARPARGASPRENGPRFYGLPLNEGHGDAGARAGHRAGDAAARADRSLPGRAKRCRWRLPA